jgi:xylan 1,4-beta-xylosidase
MSRKPVFLSCLLLAMAATALARDDAPRVTSYRNPVIPGFHPDPSIIRVGETFYLVNSTFEFFPGVPLHRSRDLVHWEPIGNVLTRPSQLPLEGLGPSLGVFAPTIRHHEGTYYMITTLVGGHGNFYVTATDPAGEWSDPIWIRGQGGIDPSLFFDDDGKVYLHSTGGAPGQPGESGIHQSTIDLATGELTSEPRLVWRGTGGRYPEGPHMYKVGGRYYLMISEGGTEYGHMVTIARSDRPTGPFEACPRNPILTHRDTQLDQPIQGTGHPDLVEDHEGSWWMVFLAFRPQGGYFHHLGRETFLAPVRWDEEGWPVVNEGRTIDLDMKVRGLPQHLVPARPGRDGFDDALGVNYDHIRNPVARDYSTTERPGWLTLHGSALTLATADASPTFVGRRQQHLRARVAARLDFAPGRDGEEAGMVLYRHPFHRYELGVRRVSGEREVFVRQTIGERLSATTASAPLPGTAPVELQVVASPLEYTLSFTAEGGEPKELDRAITRFLSSEVAGGFVGTYVGLYATGNGEPATTPAAFDWFDYEPRPED